MSALGQKRTFGQGPLGANVGNLSNAIQNVGMRVVHRNNPANSAMRPSVTRLSQRRKVALVEGSWA